MLNHFWIWNFIKTLNIFRCDITFELLKADV